MSQDASLQISKPGGDRKVASGKPATVQASARGPGKAPNEDPLAAMDGMFAGQAQQRQERPKYSMDDKYPPGNVRNNCVKASEQYMEQLGTVADKPEDRKGYARISCTLLPAGVRTFESTDADGNAAIVEVNGMDTFPVKLRDGDRITYVSYAQLDGREVVDRYGDIVGVLRKQEDGTHMFYLPGVLPNEAPHFGWLREDQLTPRPGHICPRPWCKSTKAEPRLNNAVRAESDAEYEPDRIIYICGGGRPGKRPCYDTQKDEPVQTTVRKMFGITKIRKVPARMRAGTYVARSAMVRPSGTAAERRARKKEAEALWRKACSPVPKPAVDAVPMCSAHFTLRVKMPATEVDGKKVPARVVEVPESMVSDVVASVCSGRSGEIREDSGRLSVPKADPKRDPVREAADAWKRDEAVRRVEDSEAIWVPNPRYKGPWGYNGCITCGHCMRPGCDGGCDQGRVFDDSRKPDGRPIVDHRDAYMRVKGKRREMLEAARAAHDAECSKRIQGRMQHLPYGYQPIALPYFSDGGNASKRGGVKTRKAAKFARRDALRGSNEGQGFITSDGQAVLPVGTRKFEQGIGSDRNRRKGERSEHPVVAVVRRICNGAPSQTEAVKNRDGQTRIDGSGLAVMGDKSRMDGVAAHVALRTKGREEHEYDLEHHLPKVMARAGLTPEILAKYGYSVEKARAIFIPQYVAFVKWLRKVDAREAPSLPKYMFARRS